MLNIVGNDAWNVLHIETIHNLLDAWADTAHILHSSDEQRTYVAIALLYFVKYARYLSIVFYFLVFFLVFLARIKYIYIYICTYLANIFGLS